MMTKLDYLKRWFNVRGYKRKAAIQSIITIQLEEPDSSGLFKEVTDSVFIEKGQFFTFIEGVLVALEGDVSRPFAVMDDKFTFPNDFHPVLQGKGCESTFGLMLFNIVLFWEPFKEKVGYVNKEFTDKFIIGLLNNLMVDNPKPGEEVPPGKASVDDCLKFSSNASYLQGLGSHYIKPGGIDAVTVHPSVLKLRDELFEKHKHELKDPVVFTKLVEEVIAADRKIQLSGPSKNFFINDKFISNARKRMFIAFGIEPNANDDGWVALPRSLDEGIDPKEIVTYINTAIVGAYSRAMATGDGGARVKETIRLVGRQSIATVDGTENGEMVQDCGSQVGEFKIISEKTLGYWMGAYVITASGPVMLDEENAKTFINKPLRIRVPQFCMQPDNNFCATCAGRKLGMYGNRVSAEVVRVPTEQLLGRMKAAHLAGNRTVTLDLKAAIS
jgi:hypothetical protein